MDLFERYKLKRVINACGKMTALSGAIVLPEIAEAAAESLKHFFVLDELQAAAGRVIAAVTGAESGCVTACTAAGITLGVAACMTGNDLAKVLQLPDTDGMSARVLIQKGHCINYGNPDHAGDSPGRAPRPSKSACQSLHASRRCDTNCAKGDVAAVVHVESHHTVRVRLDSAAGDRRDLRTHSVCP